MGFVHEEMEKAVAATRPRLKLLRRSGLTPDFGKILAGVGAGNTGIRRFVGVYMHPTVKKLATTDMWEDRTWRPEYLQAAAQGHLVAADEVTAREIAKYVGKPEKWRDYLATDEELKLHEQTAAKIKSQDEANERAAKAPPQAPPAPAGQAPAAGSPAPTK